VFSDKKKLTAVPEAFRDRFRIESLESRLLLNTNIPPEAVIESPLPDAVIPSGGSVNLQGSGTDEDGTIVEWRWLVAGPQFIQPFFVEDPGSVTLPMDGYYLITLTAIDDQGDADATPPLISVRVGTPFNQPPDGTIVSPPDGIEIEPGGEVVLSATAADPDGEVTLHYWVVYGPKNYNKTFDVQNPGKLVLTEEGSYSFVYVCADIFYQPDNTPAIVTVTVREKPKPPDGIIDSPLADAVIRPGESVDLQATGSDPDGSIVSWKWIITGPGGFVYTSTDEDPGALELTAVGPYLATLTVTDDDGVEDPTPAVVEFSVQDPDNFPPNGTIDSPVDGSVIQPGGSIDLQSSATDPNGDDTVATWNWKITGPDGYEKTYSVADPGALTLENAGIYTITLTVADEQGAKDSEPAVSIITVGIPGMQTLGVIETAYGAGRVYVYDMDGDDEGAPIDGDYENYNPHNWANDLIIFGTPYGVVIQTRAVTYIAGQWVQTDFSNLGIAVDGKLHIFADRRVGTGNIAFLASSEGMGSVYLNSEVTGLKKGDLQVTRRFVVPEESALYNKQGDINWLVMAGEDAAGASLLGDVYAEDIRTFFASGDVAGNINLTGNFHYMKVGYAAAADVTGKIEAATADWLFINGSLTGEIKVAGGLALLDVSQNLPGVLDAGSVGRLTARGNLAGTVVSGTTIGYATIVGNLSGRIESKGDIDAVVIYGSVDGATIITRASILNFIVSNGFDGSLTANYLQTFAVIRGNLEGALDLGAGAANVIVLDGDCSAGISADFSFGNVFVGKGTFSGMLSADRIGAVVARATGSNGAQRASIVAGSRINILRIAENMIDTDVGVGVSALPAGVNAVLGNLYIGGNIERSNILAGIWNDPDGTSPFSSGAEDGTPYVPAGFLGTSRLANVFIGGAIGTPGETDTRWAIASKDTPYSFRPANPAPKYNDIVVDVD